jgi:hypothetical protein
MWSTRAVAVLGFGFGAMSMGCLSAAIATVPAPYPQAEARVVPNAHLLQDDASKVKVKVTCAGAIAWGACRGRVRLVSRDPIATARGGSRRVVEIARGDLEEFRPGDSVEIVMAVKSKARFHLRSHRRTRVTGYVDNLVYATGRTSTTEKGLAVVHPR